MQNAAILHKIKILDELAGGQHGLRADAGSADGEVGCAKLRHESLQRAGEFGLGEGAPDFIAAHAGILGEKPPQSGKTK